MQKRFDAADRKCMRGMRTLALLGTVVALSEFPAAAAAHGPVAPSATSYLARVSRAPAGVDAKVIDGYLRMWLRVVPSETLVVLDYRGAPYLRFSRSGVYVNENSEMYYLNQTVPEIPPPHLSRGTPPKWQRVSEGHEYEWHDGRIGSLAATVILPRTSYVGRWSIAGLLNGHLSAVAGGLWHAPNPSLVWFWLIVVLIACLLAAWRLPRPELHARLSRLLSVAVLIALAVGGVGRELHGRPNVSIEQLVLTVSLLAFAAWGVGRALRDRVGFVLDLVIGFVVLWMGFELLSTLVHGFVLTAVPALVARTAAVLCIGGGLGLILLAVRIAVDDSRGLLGDGSDDRGDAPVDRQETVATLSVRRDGERGPGGSSPPGGTPS
jgi:hypothetical protein